MRNQHPLLFFASAVFICCILTGCIAVTIPENQGDLPDITITLPQSAPAVEASSANQVPAQKEEVSPSPIPSDDPSEPESIPSPSPDPTPSPTIEPTPSPVPSTPDPSEPEISGTVSAVGTSDMILRLENGNTVHFLASGTVLSGIHAGDSVSLTYSGDILDQATVKHITVLEPASSPVSVSGTVLRTENGKMFVQVASGNVFGFLLTGSTSYTGLYASPVAGDGVTVFYEGDLLSIPSAVQVRITDAAPSRSSSSGSSSSSDSSLINKHLKGIVTNLSDSRITVRTSKGKTYSFKLTHKTCYTGGHPLEKGCQIRVTYDGYASNTPNAKIIDVLEPPAPKPTKVPGGNKTTSGTVDSISGIWLVLTNGFVCDLSSATVTGSGLPGSQASITYYEKDGTARAVKVIFS